LWYVKLTITVRSPGELEERLINGDLDVVVGYFWHRAPTLHFTPLFFERQVAYCGKDHPLFDRAGRVSIDEAWEHEWCWRTYPLPEAQLDRFMFLIHVGYPTEDEEMKILDLTTTGYEPKIKPVLSGPEILELQRLVRQVEIGEEIMRFIVRLVRRTRVGEPEATESVKRWVSWGAGPRACQNLVVGAKATALLDGVARRTPIESSRALAEWVGGGGALG